MLSVVFRSVGLPPPIIRFAEPAAGSGVMVLALMNVILTENPAHLAKTSFSCIDLDNICVKMVTVQILANCLMHQVQLGELITMRGNALGPATGLETYFHASSPEFMEMEKKERRAEESKAKLKQVVGLFQDGPAPAEEDPQDNEVQEESVATKPTQLSIMDFLKN